MRGGKLVSSPVLYLFGTSGSDGGISLVPETFSPMNEILCIMTSDNFLNEALKKCYSCMDLNKNHMYLKVNCLLIYIYGLVI